jgi:hypothetical protein
MSQDIPLVGPRLKINRAEHHVAVLGELVTAYAARNPCRVVCHDGSERNKPDRHIWLVHIDEPPPADLRTTLGDIVHNLRSALDLMACDLVALNKGNPKNVYFPIADASEQLDARIKDKHFDRASEEAISLLRKIGPYPGGEHHLRALHDLDIMDKHKRLIPVMSGAIMPNFAISGNISLGTRIEIREGQGVFDLPATPVNSIGQTFFITSEFKFPKESPFPREPIVPALRTLCADTLAVVDEFAALYAI